MGMGLRRQVVPVTYRRGAEVIVTVGPLKTGGEEQYVQVIKSLNNILSWRMCVTALYTTNVWKATAMKQILRSL